MAGIKIRGNHFSKSAIGILIEGNSNADIDRNFFNNSGIGISINPKQPPTILIQNTVGLLDEIKIQTGSQPTSEQALDAARDSGLLAWAKANGIALADLAASLLGLMKG